MKIREETHLPPTLALVLCLAFIYFMLRLERRQSTDVSRVLWVPTIWMLVTASKPLGAWLHVRSTNPEQGGTLDLVFQAALILVAIVILSRRHFDWSGTIRKNAWLMAFVAFMLLSVLWSDFPWLSFKRWGKELLAVLMAFIVLSEPSPRRAMESIFKRMTYILIPLSPVLIKYFPEYGRLYTPWSGEVMWTGVANHKNSLASLCIISATFLIWSLVRRRQGHNPAGWKYQTYAEILILAMAFWMLGGPGGNVFYSATSIYAFSAGLLVWGACSLAKKRGTSLSAKILTPLVIGIIVFGTVSVFTAGSRLGFFASAAGRDATLTGRTQVWTSLVPVVMKSPMLGKGFGVFWTPERREYFQISGAHNGYLDVLLELGFVGIILVSAFYLSACGKARRELLRDFDWGVLWMASIIITLVHNMGESSLSSFTNYLTAAVLFMTVASTNMTRAGARTDGA